MHTCIGVNQAVTCSGVGGWKKGDEKGKGAIVCDLLNIRTKIQIIKSKKEIIIVAIELKHIRNYYKR